MTYSVLARRAGLCAMAALAAACSRDLEAPAHSAPRLAGRHVAAVVEITFQNIGRPNMTSSAIVGSSVAQVEAIRAAQMRRGGGARFDLSVPEGQDSDATIQLALASHGAFTDNDTIYFDATYRVRNARKTDSVAFASPRQNLTFVAVSSAATIEDSPVLVFNDAGGSPIDPLLTRDLKPSGLVAVGAGGVVEPVSADVMQIFTEAEIAAFAKPVDVTNTFPYGFVTHRVGSTTTRTLDASPAPDLFQGEVSFAYRFPHSAGVPNTITVLMLALDDNVVKVTQSLEEQVPPGPTNTADRAQSLSAAQVRLLNGGSVPTTIPTQLFCSVRTAGFPGVPTASLTNGSVAAFVSLTPNPYAVPPVLLPLTSTISATFSSPVTGPANSSNFVVQGSLSGHRFVGQAYNPNHGTTVTTPSGAFLMGENVDVTVIQSLGCPGWVGRLRVAATASATLLASTSSSNVGPSGTVNRAVVAGDFNNDGAPDAAFRTGPATAGTNNAVVVLRGSSPGFVNDAADIPLSGNTYTGGIVAADFNGDGKLDIAFLNGNNVLVYQNNTPMGAAGAHTFIFVPMGSPTSVGSNPLDLAVGDFNADGIPDLVVWFADHIAVLLGNGSGGFQLSQTIPITTPPRAVVVGDLNQDGTFDLVVASANASGTLTVYLGNGDGTFRVGQSVTNGNPISGLAIGDLNNDGHLDVVTADSTARTVTVRLGIGNGTLGAPAATTITIVGAGQFVSNVVLANMTSATNLDLVLVNGGNRISLLPGNGQGGFGAQANNNTVLTAVQLVTGAWAANRAHLGIVFATGGADWGQIAR